MNKVMFIVGESTRDMLRILCVLHDDYEVDALAPTEDTDGKVLYFFQLPTTHDFLCGLPQDWRPADCVLETVYTYEETHNPAGAAKITSK